MILAQLPISLDLSLAILLTTEFHNKEGRAKPITVYFVLYWPVARYIHNSCDSSHIGKTSHWFEMGSAEKFCLRWNDFESNISKAFSEIRDDRDFFDVTLACEGEQIEAHKVILSACSPFFQTILKRNRHEHPLLYLKGVKYIDLMAILNFMYHGEVNVAQEDLNSFLAIAEDLKVKGLTQNTTTEAVTKQQNSLKSSKPKPRELPQERQLSKSSYQPVAVGDGNNDVECVPVKTEPSSFVPEHQHIHVEDVAQQNQVAETNLDNSMYEEHYGDYGNYEEGAEAGFEGDLITTDSADGNKGEPFC